MIDMMLNSEIQMNKPLQQAFYKYHVLSSAFMVYSVAQLKIFARLFFVFEAAEQLPTKEVREL